MSGVAADLRSRFSEIVQAARGGILRDGGLVVATSGGLDSMALLHLFRFGLPSTGIPIYVAHFDHRMRDGSLSDAEWVRGVARAWALPIFAEHAQEPLRSEESARNARYAFLESVRREVNADVVVTGHHADDQAETVLFRLLRGGGTVGLSGMAGFREPGLWRPLLPFWRKELVEYTDSVRLGWRQDPSNLESAFARNVIRNRIIPEVESSVAPGARRSLVRLAEQAQDDVEVWRYLMPQILETLDLEQADDALSVDHEQLLRLPMPLRGHVLRWLSERLGARLDAVGTRSGAEFISSGQSGRRLDLAAGVVVRCELDRIVLVREQLVRDRPLRISSARAGSGSVTLGGRTFTVRWGGTELSDSARDSVAVTAPHFPLKVRARESGDRIQLPYGSKKLKKLLLEARIPESLRGRLPIFVDARGKVLWIPGVATAVGPEAPADGSRVLHLGIDDADTQ